MRIVFALWVSLVLHGAWVVCAIADPATESPSDHFAQGVLASERGQVDRAIELFEAVVWLQPDHAEAQYNLGLLLGERERWDDAMASLEEALDDVKCGRLYRRDDRGRWISDR